MRSTSSTLAVPGEGPIRGGRCPQHLTNSCSNRGKATAIQEQQMQALAVLRSNLVASEVVGRHLVDPAPPRHHLDGFQFAVVSAVANTQDYVRWFIKWPRGLALGRVLRAGDRKRVACAILNSYVPPLLKRAQGLAPRLAPHSPGLAEPGPDGRATRCFRVYPRRSEGTFRGRPTCRGKAATLRSTRCTRASQYLGPWRYERGPVYRYQQVHIAPYCEFLDDESEVDRVCTAYRYSSAITHQSPEVRGSDLVATSSTPSSARTSS